MNYVHVSFANTTKRNAPCEADSRVACTDVKWVELVLHIRGVAVSDLIPETRCSDSTLMIFLRPSRRLME
jgi:hypothetical protein